MFKTLALLAAIGLVTLTGCDSADPNTDTSSITTESVFAFTEPSTPIGTSTLTRTDDAVSMTLESAGFPEGTALTVWWVVFNDPAACSDGVCGEDDVFVDAATPRTSVLFAAGGVIGADGRARFDAQLREGGPIGEIIVGPAGDRALEDARGAEVHLVVRSHGPAMPGQTEAQTTTYGGGCTVDRGGEADLTAAGECGDVQFAVHLP